MRAAPLPADRITWFRPGVIPGCIIAATAIVHALAAGCAHAFEIDYQPDVKLRWDNTIKYSTAWRAEDRIPALVADANTDDGNRNFDPGFISNRVDLLSELDVTIRNVGGRVSVAAWYDAAYHRSNDNDSAATANSFSVDHDEFTDATQQMHGRKVEILDAFVFANGHPASVPANLRVGRHTLLWGESLLLATNSISYAQAPLDFIKAISVPGTQAKELFMPVGQISGLLRPSTRLSLAAYYQFEWRGSRLPRAGSYFSSADFFDEGSERLFFGPDGEALFHGRDQTARDQGQWGISTRYWLEPVDIDFGLYYLRFHEKLPQLYLLPGAGLDPALGKTGEYSLVYPEEIQLIGVSFATTVADVSLAGEVHGRFNTPLASIAQTVLPGTKADNADNPLYAVGNTLHAQVSATCVLPPGPLWDSAALLGELGWQSYTHISKNPEAFDPSRKRHALGMQMVFTPTYYQVLPDLDLDLPFTLGYTPEGRSALAVFNGPHEGGTMSIGVSALYRKVLKIDLKFTHFFGSETYQTLQDRDFLSLSIQRTF